MERRAGDVAECELPEVRGVDVEHALSKAILEEPDDDLPRLAYADWFEERGGEADAARAEFIRVQIAQARLPADDPRRANTTTQGEALWERYRTEWFGPAS